MKFRISMSVSIAILLVLRSSSSAQVINVTADGTPVMGLAISPAAENSGKDELNNSVTPSAASYSYSTNGYVHSGMERGGTTNGGSWPGYTQALVDGKTTTYSDTEYDGYNKTSPPNPDDTYDPMGYDFGSAYVGMTGLQTISSTHPVTTIQLTFQLDLYSQPGSYFGDNGTQDAYQTGGTGDYYLHLPSNLTLYMQTTTDGTTWTDKPFTTNYVSVMNGLDLGNGSTTMLSPAVTFTLAGLSDGENIAGIRVIGTVGGGRDDGMLGVAEMEILTPEPSTYAMVGLGAAALFLVARSIRRTA